MRVSTSCSRKITYKEVRDHIYEGLNPQQLREDHGIDLKKFTDAPYTWCKAVLYVELASFFTYFSLKAPITPNFVSLLYGLSSGIGGAMIYQGAELSNTNLFYAGIIIIFVRGAFDWSDGAIARLKYGTSQLGHVLDVHAARVNYLLYYMLMIAMMYQIYLHLEVVLVGIGIFFLHSTLLSSTAHKYIDLKKSLENLSIYPTSKKHWLLRLIFSLCDDRARSIDLGLATLLVYYHFGFTLPVTLYFTIFSARLIAYFIVDFRNVVRSGN